MSIRLDQDITNLTANLAARTGEETVKVSGKLALKLLLVIAKKLEQTEENKKGIVSLKRLQKSGEELQVVKLNVKHLKKFNELSKKYRIPYAAITQEDQSRIFIKSSNVGLVNEMLKDILKDAKENSIKDVSIDKLNFQATNENEKFFRYSMEKIKIEKAVLISKILNLVEVKNEMLIKDFLEEKNESSIELKISNEMREKAKEEIKLLEGKSKEELMAIYKVSKKELEKNEKRKLDEVIEEAKNGNIASKTPEKKEHKKQRVLHEER